MRQKSVALLILTFVFATPLCFADSYKIDPEHSTVGFKIRHLFSYVRGNFDQFEGTIDYAPGKSETWSANATIQATSINTKVEPRDKHLRSGRDAAQRGPHFAR